MTPAEHAATVREALGVREWAASITPSAYGEKVEREMPEAFASLDSLVALAERATELQRDVHAAWEVARAQCERAERAETALRATLRETAP